MARVKPRRGSAGPWVIEADDAAERALLAFCQARLQGALVLEGACYPVSAEALIAPDNLSEAAAHRVREAFERSARSHQQATGRRQGFSTVDD